ncbi:unnamed protein product [Ranitomeya imitator]|uniref:Uncharacterized protein n=1 Tax=Ranitomeya imitator TaxID=111125 RepID=A0ABN9MH85_9NEOB|nr:unnamed protein product [Ranitomeya imitator]
MLVCLLYMLVFLTKEEQLIEEPDVTPKCRIYIQQMVQFMGSLEQNGKISVSALEQEMSKLLDDIVIFSPPDLEVQKRHMALSSLFMELLMVMNNASVTTAESLRGALLKWIDSKVQGMMVMMPLLTAACQSLASIKHMAEATEACILAYFRDETLHNQNPGWGPILASLQVPELTTEEFLQECLTLGSYLTLHVYVLQCLNQEQTLANELRILVKISKWIEQAQPSSVNEEPKLFLWIHKILQLSLIQVEQNDIEVTEHVLRTLVSVQARLCLLSEERMSTDLEVQKRHMALSSLFMELLMVMNNASVTTAESLRGALLKWIDSKVQGMMVMPLLTAACQSLASIKHMAEATEACILAYFRDETLHNQNPGWGPILASLQVPELTTEEFLQECLTLGSYLTLHVYVLQCLNQEQTLANELRILVKISKWIEQAQPRFRIIARSLAAFVLAQIPAENKVRLKAGTGPHLSPKAQQALNTVESLSSGKQYAEYQEQISQAVQFIQYPGHCLQDGNTLLALLINSLYPEVHYLNIIR